MGFFDNVRDTVEDTVDKAEEASGVDLDRDNQVGQEQPEETEEPSQATEDFVDEYGPGQEESQESSADSGPDSVQDIVSDEPSDTGSSSSPEERFVDRYGDDNDDGGDDGRAPSPPDNTADNDPDTVDTADTSTGTDTQTDDTPNNNNDIESEISEAEQTRVEVQKTRDDILARYKDDERYRIDPDKLNDSQKDAIGYEEPESTTGDPNIVLTGGELENRVVEDYNEEIQEIDQFIAKAERYQEEQAKQVQREEVIPTNPLSQVVRQQNRNNTGEIELDLENPEAPPAQTVNIPGTGYIPPADISEKPYEPPEKARVGLEYGSGTDIPGRNYLTQDKRAEPLNTAKATIEMAEGLKFDSAENSMNIYDSISPKDKIDPRPGRDMEGPPVNPAFEGQLEYDADTQRKDTLNPVFPTEEVENEIDTPGENFRETTAQSAAAISYAGQQIANIPASAVQLGAAAVNNPGGTASKVVQGSRKSFGTEGLSETGFSQQKLQDQAAYLELAAGAGVSSLVRKGTLRGVTTEEGLRDIASNPLDNPDAGPDVEISNTYQAKPEEVNPELARQLAEMDLQGTRGPAGSGRIMYLEGDGKDVFAGNQDLLVTTVKQGDREFKVFGRTSTVGEAGDEGSEGLVASEFQAFSENNRILNPDKQSSKKVLQDFSSEVEASKTDVATGLGPTEDARLVRTQSRGTGEVDGESFTFYDETERFKNPNTDADFLQSKSISTDESSKSSIGSEGLATDRSNFNFDDNVVRNLDNTEEGSSSTDIGEFIDDIEENMQKRGLDDTDADSDPADPIDDDFIDEGSDTSQETVLMDDVQETGLKGVGTDSVQREAFEKAVKDEAVFNPDVAPGTAGSVGTVAGVTGAAATGAETGLFEESGTGMIKDPLADQGTDLGPDVDQDNTQFPFLGRDSILDEEQDIGQKVEQSSMLDDDLDSGFRDRGGRRRRRSDSDGKRRRTRDIDLDQGRDDFDPLGDFQQDVDFQEEQGRFASSLTAILGDIQAEEGFDEEQTFTGFEIRPLADDSF